ncbi:hypothetical protein K435DRAFT_840567, partial [Dendrothele bispora CBS 962.96]
MSNRAWPDDCGFEIQQMRYALDPRNRRPLLRGIYLTDTGGSHPKKGKRKGKGEKYKEKRKAQSKPECNTKKENDYT